MKPVYLSILQKETGTRIKTLLKEKGYTVKDIQEAMGFEYPQAIYKWLSGNSLPTLDNFVILSRVLNTRIEDILVIDEDIVFIYYRAEILSDEWLGVSAHSFVPEHKKRNFILVPNLTKSAMESIKKDEPKKKQIVIMKSKLDRYSLRIGRIKLYAEGKKRL